MTQFNEIQQLKRDFFALRNGVIADALRKAGSPYKIIFGLNIPQIKEIATRIGSRTDLADILWANNSTRESMLLAPMIHDRENFTPEKAAEWIKESPTTECIDMLCHSLIRHIPEAMQLAIQLSESTDPLQRYAAYRIMWHFITTQTEIVHKAAKAELTRENSIATPPARQIIEEIDFINETTT